jgi:hypothetical protein
VLQVARLAVFSARMLLLHALLFQVLILCEILFHVVLLCVLLHLFTRALVLSTLQNVASIVRQVSL